MACVHLGIVARVKLAAPPGCVRGVNISPPRRYPRPRDSVRRTPPRRAPGSRRARGGGEEEGRPIASFDGVRFAATAPASGARGAISVSTLAMLAAIAYTVINTRRSSALRARRAAANAATRFARRVRRLCGPRPTAASWASDEAKAEGDVERVEWFNTFSTPRPTSRRPRATVRRVIEPKLDSQRPKGISR